MIRLKTIRSHAGHAQLIAELSAKPIGYIPRAWRAEIPSPYAYSPTTAVWRWRGKRVLWSEVAHRRYELYELPSQMEVFKRENDALNATA